MSCRQRYRLALAALGALCASAAMPALAQSLPSDPPGEHDIALMGTIPIYWGERAELAELLAPQGKPHWARTAIEEQYRLRPLDYLSADALRGHRRLLLAQPRGLSAEENVALDAWVRAGGRLLLFADPMMTSHSNFPIGDRRRPQDVALLSPILAHWGLELLFDETRHEGLHLRESVPPGIRVELAGELVLRGQQGECALLGEGILAECHLGEGAALILADAALLDDQHGDATAFGWLLVRIFGNRVPPPATLTDSKVNN